MGDYAEPKRTSKTTVPEAARPQRKPLPKGSDGSKPRARMPGEKPKPKWPEMAREPWPAAPRFVDPMLTPTESTLAFPTIAVGSTTTKTIGLVNDDVRPLVVDAISPARPDPFDDFEVVQPRSVEVAPGEQTNIEIRFAPSRAGSAAQTFQVTTSDGPVGASGDFEVVGQATEWRGQTTSERVQLQDRVASDAEAARAVDPLHAQRVIATKAVEEWARRTVDVNQQAADWSRDNWIDFLGHTGGAYTLYPNNRMLKTVKSIVGDWLDLALEVEAPEGKLFTGIAEKLGAKHIQEVLVDFFFDKLSGEERPSGDERAASAAESVGKAALGKSREIDAYRDRGKLAIDDARSAAELKIQSARTAAQLETWKSWSAERSAAPVHGKMSDRSLRDHLLKEWLLQRAATPDSANRETNPKAWEEVKKRMKDGGIVPTLERQDLFLYQCQYEWQKLGLADADAAVAQLDDQRAGIDDDVRRWSNDPGGASREWHHFSEHKTRPLRRSANRVTPS